MANNYSQATVSPSLPTSALTPLELEMLIHCGYSCSQDGDNTYFYCEECDRIIYEDDWAQYGLVDYADDPSYTKYSEAIGPDTEIDAVKIFQDILNKLECAGIPYITIEGAYTCSKMRQGEFGGFAVLITRDGVKSVYTGQWLSEACHEEVLKNESISPLLPLLRG